ncbi:MAG TPA: glycoside hydrolase family 99-like domain-containing protein [Candidatus Udaeobacter sp.]|nr:glycoside hydrolase family 99-like domain-containing protein [Candidatus Udaeobacter sp.]
MRAKSVRAIAFYLPQFHPTPENDAWWGKGFTEWTNVAKAHPLFRGHYQPHLPADLGFYDLRLSETREAQAELAREHGISGFCYYHYWFNGKRLLERPFDEVLASGKPDFPFCLCWANESWSRRWLGEERDLLAEQTYSHEDDLAHADWLGNAFADNRYIRIGGRPLLLVYRPTHLPDANRTVELWRGMFERHHLGNPYLVGVDAHCPGFDCRQLGFDSTLAFTPQLSALPGWNGDGWKLRRFLCNMRMCIPNGRTKVYDIMEARRAMAQIPREFPHVECVFVGWDNTPRRGSDGIMMINGTAEEFGAALRSTIHDMALSAEGNDLLFINAWNEWAEGNHLEPDQRFGCGYLQQVKQAVDSSRGHENDA